MKSSILLIMALLFSACTAFPIFGKKEQIEDRELETFYQKLTQEIEEKEEIVTKEENVKLEPETEGIAQIQEKQLEEKVIPKKNISEQRILFVGDSVMKGSEVQLKKMFPNAIIDSSVSRQFTLLPDVLRKVQNQNKRENIPDIIVIHLGSNGTFREKQMEEAMQIVGKKRKIFFINCKVEKPWEGPVNDFLKKQIDKYPNASLIDWYTMSAGKSDYFAKDGVHPNTTGAKIYRQMIQQKLEKEF